MKNRLKFWGTRGSCPVSGPEYVQFGGNTSCLEVCYEDAHLIIDAGTGIRLLGDVLLKQNKRKIDLFLSHTHWDHLIGFPFFEPIYHKDFEITIWAPQGPGRSCHELFKDLLSPEFFPVHFNEVQAKLNFRPIQEKKPLQLGPLTLDFCATRHPCLAYSFKIKTPYQTIGYVTDNEIQLAEQRDFIAFHKRADIFVHEVQYTNAEYGKKKGWGHSSFDNAMALINEIAPSRWFVTHHDPSHTDAALKRIEKLAQSSPLPCPVEWVPDGHVLNLINANSGLGHRKKD